MPYSFFVGDLEVTSSLQETLERLTVDSEKVLNIVYQPQAVFRVKAVTRCTRYVGTLQQLLFTLVLPRCLLITSLWIDLSVLVLSSLHRCS